MNRPCRDPSGPDLLCEWGEAGVRALARAADVVIVVDVLSFSTCVDVATSRGVEVFPHRWKDDSARDRASRLGAELAGRRGQTRFSLSPATYLSAGTGERVLLPSPNGAAVALEAAGHAVRERFDLRDPRGQEPVAPGPGGPRILAGCLRNAAAVARAAVEWGRRVAVIPAGERWPDGSLRPCFEDWIGAGAILDRMAGRLAPEARSAAAAFRACRPDLSALLHECASGRELIERGYPEDVRVAAELEVSECVPVLSEGAFRWPGGTSS